MVLKKKNKKNPAVTTLIQFLYFPGTKKKSWKKKGAGVGSEGYFSEPTRDQGLRFGSVIWFYFPLAQKFRDDEIFINCS